MLLFAKMPLAQWVQDIVDWMTKNWAAFFTAIQTGGQHFMDALTGIFTAVPPLLLIIALTIYAILVSGKKWGFPVITFLGLMLLWNQGLWNDLMQTTSLVIVSSVISIVIGVPLGIWMSKSDRVAKVIQPVLDFMQTMPGFVYLIPAVAFFGIGVVPGVFASLIFSLPPTVRFTNLGIRQVPTELEEAADSYGSTAWQKLYKVELPVATPSILAGVNQTIMLALSMVVIASMVGAPGLGQGVLSALQHADVGNGFVNGLGLVILAIIIDRFTEYLNVDPIQKKANKPTGKFKNWKKWVGWLTTLVLLGGTGFAAYQAQEKAKASVNIVYVEWDSEVASTNVLAEAMRDHGYNVKITPLDNAVMWQSIAQGQADASISAWLPNTHKAQYDKYHKDIDFLGPNLKGAKLGLVVPKYMKNVNSISDLNSQANKTITGIEPGAGVTAAAEKTVKGYSNLNGWKVQTSSTGAMTSALQKAYNAKKPIIITGWSPHWMFQKYDLKYLKDPKGTMGSSENITTMARKGLKQDKPKVYKVLKNFHWTKDDMEQVMLYIQSGDSPQQAADKWIKDNPKKVDAWFK
ncbi:glycine betaine/proline transport system substrate-binding protein [Weissella uvarum]|uniref:ABC transporter permease/substrate binding protein n=1 Tax=Weissella uvarum TaxID=1479233 RepID=UPI001961809D|nr:ABC transporter permease/substrate binding protein [Weissella uvarum]MBM7617547.1 glycine betaine/proline transport system substrate-binding protein [Weissella uvarum]MCM0595571.1 ABC transporter permease/substrate binding protein [Weissella uvarum]